MHRSSVVLSIVFAAALAEAAVAQTVKHNNNTYGSPLDTIMSTHLWTDVAPAKDFVQENRRDPKSLDYTPLTGEDPPQRAKPRDNANIAALKAELDHDLAANARKGDVPKPTKTTAKTSTKTRHATAKSAE